MASYDGSIVIKTKVDTDGIKKGMSDIKSAITSIGSSLKNLGLSVSLLAAAREVRKFFTESLKMASDLQEMENVVNNAFGSMSYKVQEFSKTCIEKFGISELTAKELTSTFMAMGRGIGQSLELGSDKAIEITGRLADVMSFYNKSVKDIQTIGSSIYSGEVKPLKRIGVVMNQASLQAFALSRGYQTLYRDMSEAEKLFIRQEFFLDRTKMAAGDFIRTQNLWANQTRVLSERWKQIQVDFGRAFMVFGSLVLPALNGVLNVLTKIAYIAKVGAANIASMFGLNVDFGEDKFKSMAGDASYIDAGLEDTNKNLSKMGNNIKKNNKQLTKTLAAFDDINVLNSNMEKSDGIAGSGGGAGAGGAGKIGGMSVQQGENALDSSIKKISTGLAYLMGIAGASLVAIGLILLVFGNIPLGIGFIIAGAFLFSVSAAALGGTDVTREAALALLSLMEIASGAFIAIGIILFYLGSHAWGIGFIIAGAALFGISLAKISEFKGDEIKAKLIAIESWAAGFMLALGILLLFFNGPTPTSIGLIIAGAATLIHVLTQIDPDKTGKMIEEFFRKNAMLITGVSICLLIIGIMMLICGVVSPLSIGLVVAGSIGLITEIALNWNTVKQKTTEFFESIAGVIVGVALAIMALGIILMCSGLITPMTVGMVLVGAGILAAEVATHWDAVKTSVSNFLDSIKGLIIGVASALLVLGIILLFTGVGIPLALGLIVAGGGILAAEIAANWNFILDKIKEIWGKIKDFWQNNIAKYFTAEWWGNLAKNAINGFLRWFFNGLNALINKINSFGFDLPDILGGGRIGFNIPKLNVPQLARGAVIPPNQPFLAQLGDQRNGTNIEAPLDTIKQALSEVLSLKDFSSPQNSIMQLDGETFARLSVPYILNELDRQGYNVSVLEGV